MYVSWFLGFLGIGHFQALSAILIREQNQALSGKIRHFQAFWRAWFCMICHDSAWVLFWGSRTKKRKNRQQDFQGCFGAFFKFFVSLLNSMSVLELKAFQGNFVLQRCQQVLNPTPLNPTPATCHKRKRKLRCSFRNAALQKLHCNICLLKLKFDSE